MVEFGVDNTSFKGSVAKGYSKSWELTVLCKRWFVIQVRHCFLVNWFWLSTEDNVLADHLSRGREDEFLTEVVRTGFWSAAVTEDPYFLRHPEAGSVRTYENFESMAILESDEVSAWTPQCEGDYGPMVLDPPTPPPGQGYMVEVSAPVRGAAAMSKAVLCDAGCGWRSSRRRSTTPRPQTRCRAARPGALLATPPPIGPRRARASLPTHS